MLARVGSPTHTNSRQRRRRCKWRLRQRPCGGGHGGGRKCRPVRIRFWAIRRSTRTCRHDDGRPRAAKAAAVGEREEPPACAAAAAAANGEEAGGRASQDFAHPRGIHWPLERQAVERKRERRARNIEAPCCGAGPIKVSGVERCNRSERSETVGGGRHAEALGLGASSGGSGGSVNPLRRWVRASIGLGVHSAIFPAPRVVPSGRKALSRVAFGVSQPCACDCQSSGRVAGPTKQRRCMAGLQQRRILLTHRRNAPHFCCRAREASRLAPRVDARQVGRQRPAIGIETLQAVTTPARQFAALPRRAEGSGRHVPPH